MPTANDVLVHSLATSQGLLQRFVADLTPQDYLHRITPGANCAAWIIGHLTLSDRNALKRFGNVDLPPLPEGFEKRFSREAGCPDASDFGDVTQLMNLFNANRNALIDAARNAPPQLLDQPLDKPHPLFKNVAEVANFMAVHVSMHAGHISLIRRHLGRPPVV